MSAAPGEKRITVPFDGHVIGQGVSADTLTRLGTALQVGRVSENQVADAQSVLARFQMISTQDSLERSLNTSVEVDARYGLFSAGAKVEFAQSQAINNKSTYILASCIVSNALRSGSGYTLDARAQPLVQAGDEAGFFSAFGERFVDALHTGGEMHVLVRITSSSAEHQSKLAIALHAEYNGLATGGGFKAAYQTAAADASSHSEVVIESYIVGGRGSQIHLPGIDADQVRALIDTFPAQVAEHAQAWAAELLSYEALALPFPPPEVADDKRRVLDDCLTRKRRYWSMLSDISLAQSDSTDLFFSSVPPREELDALANRVRAVLNDLMAHSRAVASGAIAPALFIAADDPQPPTLVRRSSTSFGRWWDRRHDPALLYDEMAIIVFVGAELEKLLDRRATDIDAQTAERASLQVTELNIMDGLANRFTSLEALPRILEAPLRNIRIDSTSFNSLRGVETFSSVSQLSASGTRLTDISPLASLGGLRDLNIADNAIDSLASLAGAVSLHGLNCSGNRIVTLEPLRKLGNLQHLVLGGARNEQTADGQVVKPWSFLDNPLDDTAVLADLPLLSNILTRADHLTCDLHDIGTGALLMTAQAARVGRSNRFVATAADMPALTIIVCSLLSLPGAGVDRLLVSMYLEGRDAVALAVFDTEDRDSTSALGALGPLFEEPSKSLLWFQCGLWRDPTLLLTCRR
jgi:hypothetical protein